MKNFLFYIIMLVLFSNAIIAQGCLEDGITFSTQNQIDEFQSNYPNCTEIEGYVEIKGSNITNLNGLNVITSIGEYLYIHGTNGLTNLTGLDNLTTIGGGLNIDGNDALTNLTGLNSLSAISGRLSINYNHSLIDLTALSNLTSIGGEFHLRANSVLTNIDGLHNINVASITELSIFSNYSLSNCNIQSVYEYLSNPLGPVNIHSNTGDCYNTIDLANAFGIAVSCLPYGNYFFIDQSDIDDFSQNYPGCTELNGSVVIGWYGDVNNLSGLEMVTSIESGLTIVEADLLENLTGLENINSLGKIWIDHNDNLASLTGLDNVESNSLEYIFVYENELLSTCEVKTFCDYLAVPDAVINFHSNATGCNSVIEVEEACDAAAVHEESTLGNIMIKPNPFMQETILEYELLEPCLVEVIFCDSYGIVAEHINEYQNSGYHDIKWDSYDLPPGVFHCILKTPNSVQTIKLIKL